MDTPDLQILLILILFLDFRRKYLNAQEGKFS